MTLLLRVIILVLIFTAPAKASLFGESDLIDAILRGDIKAVEQILLRGESANSRDSKGTPILLHAAANGSTGIIALLLDNRGSVRLTDRLGNTAIITAATHGHLDGLELLVTSGAKIGTENKQGQTALMKAAENGHLVIVTYLIKKRCRSIAGRFYRQNGAGLCQGRPPA